jgi:hypothetical protein
VQQLRETFLEAAPYRYAILDHDAIFNVDVMAFLKATGFAAKTDEPSGTMAKRNRRKMDWQAAAVRSSTISSRSMSNTFAV